MPDRLPMDDGEGFLAKLEQAQEAGDPDFVEMNMPRLEALISQYMERSQELARLQYRARTIRERHEPSAAKRMRHRRDPM